MLGDWWTLSHSDAAWLIVIDRWALLAALVLPSLMHLVSCLACWRCCYYFVLLLAVRLLSCARGPYTFDTSIHTCMHYYHSRIARLAPKVEGRSPFAMALFTSMPADCRAHGEGPRSQAPSSSRCYSNYHITVASFVRESMLALARLICPVSARPRPRERR